MFEIIEFMLIKVSNKIIYFLECLCEEGVIIVIDDFGIGFSLLSILVELLIDVIKFDRMFVL